MDQLADLLEQQLDPLLKQWIARVDASLAPEHRSAAELADHIPAFVRQVIATLRGEERSLSASPVDGESLAGREHGAQRFRLGFELEAVVREYGLLQHTVLDLVQEAGASVSIREVRLVIDLFSNAIAEATAEFARRLTAEQASVGREAERLRVELETMLHSIGDGVVATDVEGRVTLLNPAAERLTGWIAGEALGRPVEEVIPLVDATSRAALPSPFAAVLRGEEPADLGDETRIVRRDGTMLVFADSLAAIRDGAGAIVGAVFVFRDRSEQQRAEAERERLLADAQAARREAEATSAEFEAMFNCLPDGAYLGDRTGIRRANPVGLALLGAETIDDVRCPLEDLQRRHRARDAATGQLLPPDRSPMARAASGEVVREEYVVWNPAKGHDVRLRTVASPVRVGDAIHGAVLLHTDITEQHRALEAIQRSEESFRTLAEVIPQQVWTATPDGAADFANQRLLAYFAETEDHFLGVGWQAFIHPEDRAGSAACWARSLETGELYEVEFRLRRADGVYRWHLGRARAARDANGTVVKWFGTNTDIDDAKKSRDELEKRADFEQHLAGIVSHDLRNPLSAILLSATSLLRVEEQSPRVTKIALRIHGAAERSVRMISDLLDFTQARLGGGIQLERRPADLYTVTSAAVDDVEAAYPDRSLELTRAGDTHGTWDADRLAQVVSNLVTNALKYSPAATKVAVRVAGQEGAVELTVHNEGPPIPPERLGRLFAPLQRASDEIDRKTRSVGLGLYIVDAIVRAHGGVVGVVSTAEEGTTFTVRLPREPGARLPG